MRGLILLLGFIPLTAGADEQLLALQREAFQFAYPYAQRGDWTAIEPDVPLLEDYVLYADLRAAWLQALVGELPDADIEAFLAAHPALPAAERLRRRWLEALADTGRWEKFLELYERHYRDSQSASLRCLALTARLQSDALETLREDALAMWMSGQPQPDECRPAFDFLEQHGELTKRRYRERLEMALEAPQFALAGRLAAAAGKSAQQRVERWVAMQRDPALELAPSRKFRNRATDRALMIYGYGRLARADPERAAEFWSARADRYSFTREDRTEITRDIALWSARKHLQGARHRLASLAPELVNGVVTEWRIRLALRDEDWPAVLQGLTDLADQEARSETWQYWLARAHEASGEPQSARQIYMALAEERSYYGFLAADRLGMPYAYSDVRAHPDEAVLKGLAMRPDLIRAQELFLVGLYGEGRSEWDRATRPLPTAVRAQAAILAHRRGWHSRAIATAARSGLMDDLELRYPLPFPEFFARVTTETSVASAWAYGVARSESLFMPDISSSAGALGVMQLMPATGREVARREKVAYRGRASLLDPQTNIKLGTLYLARMLERFSDNPVLATAAYNAGPSRVTDWLPDRKPLPADVWVESIPFGETRGYVRRVLSSKAIFYWRLNGHSLQLDELMRPVRPGSEEDTLVSHGSAPAVVSPDSVRTGRRPVPR